MHKLNFVNLPRVGFLFVLLLAACSAKSGEPSGRSDPTSSVIAEVETATVTASPRPPRVLTICTGSEPASLFLYAENSLTARNVRQAIYDGPIDVRGFQLAPVILEKLPALADGDVTLEPVQVLENEVIVDSHGNLTNLVSGTLFRPNGCSSDSCAIAYESPGEVQMDQLVVRFKLRPDLLWSDGSPLMADDSVYSFEVAKSLYPQARAELLAHSYSYQALDATTVEWRGVPGYQDPGYAGNFFSPLPRQAWSGVAPSELITDPRSARTPLGWGPYIIQDWSAGEHITLVPNPNYFRAAESLPHFDQLIFRFTSNASQALAALQSGECDLVDDSLNLETQWTQLDELQKTGKYALAAVNSTGWEHLDFGLMVSNPKPENPDLFQTSQMRQAIAQCIDRQKIASELSPDQPVVPDTYVPPTHPLFNPQARRYIFDPPAGRALLDSIGWLENDGDPATPRQSLGIPGIPDGTFLTFSLLTTNEPQKLRVSQVIKESLMQCGILVEVSSLPIESFYAPGPEGPVFGRSFSMAQFGWSIALEPPCYLYTTSEIPGAYPDYPKGWGGANASGYSNPEYDLACQTAMNTLPDDPQHREAHLQAQAIFSEDLPSVPLYLLSRIVALRADLCNVIDSASDNFAIWNLESFDYGDGCVR